MSQDIRKNDDFDRIGEFSKFVLGCVVSKDRDDQIWKQNNTKIVLFLRDCLMEVLLL